MNQSILDLRGQAFSVEMSPWLARFMLDEGRMRQIKHLVGMYGCVEFSNSVLLNSVDP
jgi:hypothetical protein